MRVPNLRILRPLERPPVALLWGGLATSAIGDQIYVVAIAWIGVAAFGPRAGWLTALGAGCVLVTALFSGPWVDRHHPATAMVAADLARALVLLLVVAAWGSGLPLPVWAGLLVVAVMVLGIGQGVFRPALQDVMPATVAEPALLPAANALFDSTERIARLLGPGVIGLLSAALPSVHFLSIDATTFLVSAVCVQRVARGLPPRPAPVRLPVLQALSRGYRALRRHHVLGWQVRITGLVNGAWTATYFLALPLLVERHGLALGTSGSGLGAYGLVLVGYGCTNLLANLVVGSRDMPRRPARQIAFGNACAALAMVGFGLLEGVGMAGGTRLACYVGLAMMSAVSGPLQDIPIGVLRQTDLPRADVPAAMRAHLAASQGGAMVALGAAPSLLGVVSLGAFLAGLGVMVLLVAGTTYVRDLRA